MRGAGRPGRPRSRSAWSAGPECAACSGRPHVLARALQCRKPRGAFWGEQKNEDKTIAPLSLFFFLAPPLFFHGSPPAQAAPPPPARPVLPPGRCGGYRGGGPVVAHLLHGRRRRHQRPPRPPPPDVAAALAPVAFSVPISAGGGATLAFSQQRKGLTTVEVARDRPVVRAWACRRRNTHTKNTGAPTDLAPLPPLSHPLSLPRTHTHSPAAWR